MEVPVEGMQIPSTSFSLPHEAGGWKCQQLRELP
eukprot:CAMPEP_0202406778 /NCGR_PEP_ID=MMETSP1128-20130828/10357_1 /ASSEMBLY_ACC=CAM_ASM_000463 /TAXON_ID=3047 /ORGANISM="Dunaliella tertiolecta, Strain CCMP1320" /LENGTH=33 /DNA_ID= /DNA_START= /DNA_END= /DNA_ORIENTATION=